MCVCVSYTYVSACMCAEIVNGIYYGCCLPLVADHDDNTPPRDVTQSGGGLMGQGSIWHEGRVMRHIGRIRHMAKTKLFVGSNIHHHYLRPGLLALCWVLEQQEPANVATVIAAMVNCLQSAVSLALGIQTAQSDEVMSRNLQARFCF